MSSQFVFGGLPRMAHQRAGLRKIIETRGVCALLFDPGLGKTAVALDYLSLLALKAPESLNGVREARALVVAPSVALDTWVLQAKAWLSPQVDYWAEALGGSILQRAEALAARGGNPFPVKGKNPPPRNAGHRRSLAWGGRALGRDTFTAADGLDHFDPERPRVIIESVNFDSFASRQSYRSGTVADRMLEAVRRFSPDVIIVDESHRIKGTSSNTSRLLARIAQHVPRRLMLTGTVMPHSPLDVFAQWRFLEPTAFGDPLPGGKRKRATFTGFRARYAKMGGYMGYQVMGFRNLDHLQEVMAENAIVARKEDSLDLPKVTTIEVPVHLDPDEKRAYAEMKKDLATKLRPGGALASTATAPNRLAQMMRLRQLTSGYLPDDSGAVHRIGMSKVDTINYIVNDTLLGENRVVIFCHFKEEIAQLRERLQTKGTTVEVIDGSVKDGERIAIRQRFGDVGRNPGRIVLVAQISTVSLAVNEFISASHAVFGSLSLRRDDIIQAQDRLNRMGQTKPVTFWYALAPGSVDTAIYQAHQNRTNLESAVLEHILEAAP